MLKVLSISWICRRAACKSGVSVTLEQMEWPPTSEYYGESGGVQKSVSTIINKGDRHAKGA